MQRKYKNKITVYNGIRFDSLGEARRYAELVLLQKAGKISDLKLQQKFELNAPNGKKIGVYVADFTYNDCNNNFVVEDFKGMQTPLFKWKKKHFEAQYGIALTITKK